MKRKISLLLALSMVLTVLTINVPVTGAGDGLFFELDLSGVISDSLSWQKQNGSELSNAVPGNSSGFVVTGEIIPNSFINVKGEVTKYFTFGDGEVSNPAINTLNTGTIIVDDSLFLNQDALTLEAWIRPYAFYNTAQFIGRVFSIGPGGGSPKYDVTCYQKMIY